MQRTFTNAHHASPAAQPRAPPSPTAVSSNSAGTATSTHDRAPLKLEIAPFPAGDGAGAAVPAQHLLRARVPADTPSPLHTVDWVAMMDRSGSMADRCRDGKTKAAQVGHTIRNMCGYLSDSLAKETSGPQHRVHLYSFDDRVESVIEAGLVSAQDPEGITKHLGETGGRDPLAPRGATDIGAALEKASWAVERITGDLSDALEGAPAPLVVEHTAPPYQRRVAHILLTDGHITAGLSRHDILQGMVPRGPGVRNAFIGYGHEHCAHLLQSLARNEGTHGQDRGRSYHFVDSLEHAGMVFGEVLHSVIYEQAYCIRLTVTGGTIYDASTRTWGASLDVDPMASGDQRSWVVRATGSDAPQVAVKYARTGSPGPAARCARTAHAVEPVKAIATADFEYAGMRQKCMEAMAEARACLDRERGTGTGGPARARGAPPTSTVLNQNDKVVAHALLDMAKVGQWDAVRATLQSSSAEKQQLLADALPHPRRYRLIHHAAEQGQLEVVKQLVQMGAAPVATRDGVTLARLAAPHAATLAYVATLEPATGGGTGGVMRRTEVLSHLDSLLANLQKITGDEEQYDDDERKRYRQLSDDIYITRLSMTAADSSVAAMYMGARAASQGRQGGYCGGDVEALVRGQTQEGTVFRGMTREYTVQRSGTRAGASFGATAAMRRCMGATQPDSSDDEKSHPAASARS